MSYRYPLYAQRPGTLRVAPALVTFSAAPAPGLPTRAFRLETTDHSLPVRPLPAGMPFAAAGLEVRAAVDPAGQAVTVGDARSVTITRQLEGAPALLLAPLALPDLPGATLYPGTPVLRSESGRGRLTGIREDRFTLVFEAPGTVLVPALRFPWWDAGRGEPRAVTLPALTFEVAAAGAGDGAPARRQMALAAAALLAVLVLVLVVSARRRWRGDEARHRLAAFRRAAQRNDAQAAYAAFLRWQAVAGDAAAAPVLGPPLRELEEALVAGAPWRGRHLCEALRASLRQSSSRPRALPPLNPGG